MIKRSAIVFGAFVVAATDCVVHERSLTIVYRQNSAQPELDSKPSSTGGSPKKIQEKDSFWPHDGRPVGR